MLMRDQHLYKSPAIDVYGHCRLLLPWLRVSCWFFLQSGVEKLLAWVAGDWTHNHTLDLSSQLGAYDLSATAGITKVIKRIHKIISDRILLNCRRFREQK